MSRQQTKRMYAEPARYLEKLPASTPPWAVGIVTIITSLAIGFGAVYLISKEQVQAYVDGTIAEHGHKISQQAIKSEQENATMTALLGLVQSNQQQLVSLTSAVNKAQEQNFALSERVAVIEKELSTTQTRLSECQASLAKCRK